MEKYRILIVEDEVIIGIHIQNVLVSLGYEVCGLARTADEALAKSDALKPDLILMDIVLAGSADGIEAARTIKDNLAIPVVYLTGNADIPTVQRARETAPYGYILKPVNTLNLFSTIDTALNRHMLERKVRDSEEKYRFLVEEISDIIYSLDGKGAITFISPRVEALAGYSADWLIGRTFADFVHPEDLPGVEEIMNRRARGDTAAHEFRVISKSGAVLWCQTSGKPLFVGGEFSGVRGVISDITERKRSEIALRSSDERYRALFNGAAEGILVADIATRKFLYANPAMCRMLGYSADELARLGVEDIHPPGDHERVMEDFRAMSLGEKNIAGELPCLRRDGSVFYVDVVTSTMVIDQRLCNVGFFSDVTERMRAVHEIRESEERFKSLVQSIQDMILILGPDGTVIFENDVVAQKVGRPMLGENGFGIIHPEDIPVVMKDFGELLERNNPHIPTRFRVRAVDGTWIYLDALATNLLENTTIRGMLVVCRDITRQIMDQKALVESEQRYHAMFDQSPVGVFMFDRNLTLTDCNERMAEIMHSAREKIIGLDLRRLRVTALIPLLQKTIEGEGSFWEGPYEAVTSEYSLWTSGNVSPLRDAGGDVVGGICVFENITERKVAEDNLKASEERNRILVEYAGESIVVVRDGRLAFANPAFRALTGHGGEELAGRDMADFVHPDDREPVMLCLLDRVVTGEPATGNCEARFIDRGGGTRWTELNTVFIIWEGAGASLCFIRDITERKNAEEERQRIETKIQQTQKLESLGVLAGGIAHDFNNLLMAILGNIDLAIMDLPPSSPARLNLAEAAKASQRAADLCRQMLAYSGKGSFINEPVSLNGLMDDMRKMLEFSVSKKAMLRYYLGSGLPPINADATQIRQIIMNLVINASDAIGERSGIISVSTGMMYCDREYFSGTWLDERLPEGNYVYLDVADNGSGMDPETLRNIFDPFFTTKFTGRGLGLAAVLGIVRGHHGAITVSSVKDAGTDFRVLFPASAGSAGPADADRPDASTWRGSGTILLADDEETIRSLGKQMIQRCGFSVLLAADGRQALEIFREHADGIDCVILDLTMPLMDGEETFRELRRVRGDVRVIMSSGYDEHEIRQRFAGKGLAGFIQKPYQFSGLASKLKEILG